MKIPSGESRLITSDLSLTEVLEIQGALTLDPTKSITITTTKNIIVTGKLISKPNPDIVHLIRFTGINENNYVGGGDTVLDSDVGIWVMGAGQMDLQGSVVNDWKRLGVDYAAMEKFAAAVGSNLHIEGTATGYSHLFIKSSKPQFIRNVAFRYMGPRKDLDGDGIKEFVTGRYACHFHHSDEGSRGSIIEGCIVRDCNSHCFVPHGSHGITMRNNIVYNVLEAPFWYDFGHKTNDLTWENNLVVKVGYIPRAQDQDSDGAPQGGASAFILGFGDSNTCRGNVVIGTSGDLRAAGAYTWPELRDDSDITRQLESSWTFENNTAVNCSSGENAWQNNNLHHIIRNSVLIGCEAPIYHGAYVNDYCRIGAMIKGGTVDIRAASATTNRIRFEGCAFDAQGADYCVIINEGPGTGAAPIMFRNCKFINFSKKAILNQNPGEGIKKVDVIDCGLTPDKYQVSSSAIAGEVIRVQEGNQAWRINKSGAAYIPLFAPSLWGTGTGLKAEYFSPDFATKYLERIEPNPNIFDITHVQIHYAVPASFAARWTGKIQPQFTEPYTFTVFTGGGVRLWIDNRLIIDHWEEQYPGELKVIFGAMIAGKPYDIKLEYFNQDDRSGCLLYWSSTSLKKELVPMSQLYPDAVTPPPPGNKPPTANAGADQEIEVSAMLYGTGIDPEGKPVTFRWEQTAGQPAMIEAPGAATTKVSGLKTGDNVFRLTVTDDKGASGVDEVRVTVG